MECTHKTQYYFKNVIYKETLKIIYSFRITPKSHDVYNKKVGIMVVF